MATGFANHTLGQPCSPAGVDHVQRIGALHGDRPCSDTTHARTLHQPLPVPLTPSLVGLIPAVLIPLPDENLLRLETTGLHGTFYQRAIGDGALGPFNAAGSRQDGARLGRLDALRQRFGREAAKDGCVDGAQSSDGQGSDQSSRDHGHYSSQSVFSTF